MQTANLDLQALEVLSDSGEGRAFVVVLDDLAYTSTAVAVAERIATKNRCLVVKSPSVDSTSWAPLSASLGALIQERSIRQASYLCFGAGATLAQNLALDEPKVVRSLVVVDATPRPHPTKFETFVDKVEARLPMGLPLRLGSTGFNVRSYLHRVRCPLLVITTRRASAFVRSESVIVASEAPTAWRMEVTESNPGEEAAVIADAVVNFQETPVKCPQKNLSR